jgi:hypothetical protein
MTYFVVLKRCLGEKLIGWSSVFSTNGPKSLLPRSTQVFRRYEWHLHLKCWPFPQDMNIYLYTKSKWWVNRYHRGALCLASKWNLTEAWKTKSKNLLGFWCNRDRRTNLGVGQLMIEHCGGSSPPCVVVKITSGKHAPQASGSEQNHTRQSVVPEQNHPRQSVVHIREVDYFVSPRLGVCRFYIRFYDTVELPNFKIQIKPCRPTKGQEW